MIGNIVDVIRRLAALDPAAAMEVYRLFRLLLSTKDQATLQAAIPDLERLEDEAHRDAQKD
jgi:hypothetical protein